MRICIVYDCLFPWTYGGAERWYRNLAERLAAEEETIVAELAAVQGEPVEIGGYYRPDRTRVDAVMRPSATFGAALSVLQAGTAP